jgi:hypothetical protein
MDLNDSNKEKEISVENNDGRIFIELDPLKTESKLLIKSAEKPSSLKLNNEKRKFEWNKDKGLIETNLNKETKAQIEIVY